jgi:hypothetical protein
MGLWSLPTELVTEICGHWLSIVSIAHLDSACCNHAVRTLILSTAFSESCCRDDLEHFKTKNRNDANAWIVLRKVMVPGLYITESLYSETAADYLRSHGKFLQCIMFTEDTDEENVSADSLVVTIAKHCCNIRRLETNLSVSSDGFVQIVRNCRLLEKVVIGEGLISNRAISELSSLPKLKDLSAWYWESEDLFITCPTLEFVRLHTSPDSARSTTHSAFCWHSLVPILKIYTLTLAASLTPPSMPSRQTASSWTRLASPQRRSPWQH